MPKTGKKITLISDYEHQKETHEYKRQIYEDNIRLWEAFDKTSTDMDARFDKALFTIAAGSFGISFAFIDKFVILSNALYPSTLIISWACFACCLIVLVVGHLLSAESYRKQRDEIANNMLLQFDGKTPENKPLRDIVSPCNYIALISYTGGIVCLLLFVLLNL
jgi:hypothetical protein